MRTAVIAFWVLMSVPVSMLADDDSNEVIRDSEGRLLKEVTVEADRVRNVEDGLEFVPTKREQSAAFDVYSLVSLMPISSVVIIPGTEAFSTVHQTPYKVFINGVAAETWEVRMIKPKDVLGIEVLNSPKDLQYNGESDVINIRVRRYEYGAYVMAEAKQNIFSRLNDRYSVGAKYERGKWQFMANVGALLSKSHDTGRTDATYRFVESDGTLSEVERSKTDNNDSHRNNEMAVLRATYQNNSMTLSNYAGTSFNFARPHSTSYGGIDYHTDGYSGLSYTSESNSRSNSMFYTFNGLFTLPGQGNMLNAVAYASYASSDINSSYTLTETAGEKLLDRIVNDSKNSQTTTNIQLTYTKKFSGTRMLMARIGDMFSHYSNRYSGTTADYIKRNSFENYILAAYYDRIGSVSVSATAYASLQTYTSPDYKTKNEFVPDVTLRASGKVRGKDSYNASLKYSTYDIGLFDYAGVGRQTTEIDGYSPNRDLKKGKSLSLRASYTLVLSNRVNMTPYVSGRQVFNAPTKTYAPDGDIMRSYTVSDGSFNSVSAGTSISASLPGNRVSLYGSAGYQRDQQTGTNAAVVNSGTFMLMADYMPVDNLSLNLMGLVTVPDKSYTQGGGGGYFSKQTHSYNISLTASYNIKNFQIRAIVENPWVKNNRVTKTRDTRYYTELVRSISNQASNMRYIGISVRYTFNIGKEVRYEELGYGGVSAGDR